MELEINLCTYIYMESTNLVMEKKKKTDFEGKVEN